MDFTKEIFDCFRGIMLPFEYDIKDMDEFEKAYELYLKKMDETLNTWLKALLANDNQITGKKIVEKLSPEYIKELSSLNLQSRFKGRLDYYRNHVISKNMVIDLHEKVMYMETEKEYDITFDTLPLITKLLKTKNHKASVFTMNIDDVIELYNANLPDIITDGMQEVKDDLIEEIDEHLDKLKSKNKLPKPKL